MTSHSTSPCLPHSEIETTGQLFDNQFDPIEAGLRDRVRALLQAMLEAELDEMLARPRYARRAKLTSEDSEETPAVIGHRSRSLLGTFGKVEIAEHMKEVTRIVAAQADLSRGRWAAWLAG